MKRVILSLCLLQLGVFFGATAQQVEEPLLTIGNEKVYAEEFLTLYLKNNQSADGVTQSDLDDYLNLFIAYKQKIAEAKALGINESDDFLAEFNSYRDKLLNSYMVDSLTEQQLMQEAYEHLRYEVNASHILLKLSENAFPEDTALVYEKALQIRQRLLAGEPFQNVARATSDDPSVRMNGGNLGYFSAFQMIYPFEKAVYNLQVDSISQPIRTKFGYHIIKLNEKRPSKGQVRAAHILLFVPADANNATKDFLKTRIDSIYGLVQQGYDFAEIAKEHSQDKGSAAQGGVLPWFGSGQMIPEFETVAFSLEKPGDYSEPVESPYGWHIIKLVDRKIVGSFNDELPEIKAKLSRDERYKVSQEVFMERLKEEHDFILNQTLLDEFAGMLDSSIYQGMWRMPSGRSSDVLFTFGNENYTLKNVFKVLEDNGRAFGGTPFSVMTKHVYDAFVQNLLYNFAEKQLVENNKELHYLLKEYYDGILLFEVMDREVWSKAANDTIGLEAYYLSNVQKYSWDERVYAKKYVVKDEKSAKKILKFAQTKKGLKFNSDDFLSKYNKKTQVIIAVEDIEGAKSLPALRGMEQWENSFSPMAKQENGFEFIQIVGVEEDIAKPMDDIKGQVVSDYQDYLEQEWMKKIQSKFPATINRIKYQEVFSNLN